MRYMILLLALSLVACQSTVRYTSGGDVYDPDVNNQPSSGEQSGSVVVPASMGKIIAGYLRTPYKSGGMNKDGIDCSGLIHVVYKQYNGTRLPVNSGKLFNNLRSVEYENIKYGDLIFFNLNGAGISHVGIYVGNQKFVHASKSRGVIISSMKENYYRNAFKGARRVLW